MRFRTAVWGAGLLALPITARGLGETHPLVPTGLGVRGPQNRRVEIVVR
jgi:outer membrane protein OmpA-like peptidoglycan-associated protein